MKRILDGLAILAKYDATGGFHAEHDQIWVGGCSPSKLSDSETQSMLALGWFWDDEYDSWSHFC